MRRLLLTAFVSLMPLTVFAGDAADSAAKERMFRDLDFVANVFEAKYAPSAWKRDYAGWDLRTQIELAKHRVRSLPQADVKSYQRIFRDFLYSTKDYHVGFSFYATEVGFLPFAVRSSSGNSDGSAPRRYFVSHVLDEAFDYPFTFAEGDEILTFDGRPVDTVVTEIKQGLRKASAERDQVQAEDNLTLRVAAIGAEVPQGLVTIGLRAKGSDKIANYTLRWLHTDEKIVNNMQLSGDDLKDENDPAVKFQKTFNKSMLDPDYQLIAQATSQMANPHALGVRKSFIPSLGKRIWKSSSTDLFHAYIYKNATGQSIGYVRIADYMPKPGQIKEFIELIARFQSSTDALVIDQVNNPGGSVWYLDFIASILSDMPLELPKHKIALSQEDIMQMLQFSDALQQIYDDNSARRLLGDDLHGIPVTYKVVQGFLDFIQFQLSEWNAGKTITDPYPLDSMFETVPYPGIHYTKPILILINGSDLSAGDFFPAIMQDNQRATLFGTRTAGAGGYVEGFSYPNRLGITRFSFTCSLAERKDKTPIENLGVTPDIHYEITAKDIQDGYQGYAEAVNHAVSSLLAAPLKVLR